MKKALLVGINYPHTQYALRGCVNDITSVSQVLINNFGFTEPNSIRMLVDESATTANILERLHWLVDGANPGDVLFFGYSGHGTQTINKNYDWDCEPDGLDECICPIDLDWREKIITDDMLKEIFSKVPNGVNLTVVLDCCHSGDGLRDFEPPIEMRDNIFGPTRTRALRMPVDIASRSLGKSLDPKPRALQNSAIVPVEDQTGILISGCKSNETSADAWIQPVQKFQGALTYTLLSILHENNYNITYRTLVETLNKYLEKNGFSQHPELNGKCELFDKPFLQPFV
jgi:hypothetical protein